MSLGIYRKFIQPLTTFAASSIAVFVHAGASASAPMCSNKISTRFELKTEYAIDDQMTSSVSPIERYVAQMYSHLAGAPIPMNDPHFRRAVKFVQAGQALEAARLIQTESNFLKVRVRNFSLPFIDKDFRPKDTLTDLQALIIGITRDELDARLLLTGDLRYSGYSNLGLEPVSRANNNHYAQFESGNFDFKRDLQRVDTQWDDEFAERAGALTTRAWAEAYYNMGTNRLAVKWSIDKFMCQPIMSWKIRGLPDYFVRRDIPRNPGNDPSEYQNNCRSCHSGMDGLGGAFAKLDFVNSELVFQVNGVQPKMNINSDHYPEGYVTTDDSWSNMLVNHPTVDFGWRGPASGVGVKKYGELIANSRGFSRCMVAKTFEEVCGSPITEQAGSSIDSMATDFENTGYNLKELFAKVAVMNECIKHPMEEAR